MFFCKGSIVRSPSSLKTWLKGNRYRIILFTFLAVYAYFLMLQLGYMSFLWDEMPHFYGGLLLEQGKFAQYITTYGYYPPAYDLLTASFFTIFGTTATAGRITAVIFGLLSILTIFEFTNKTYGPKTALLASIMLGVTPGFFWLSRTAMLETMMTFLFSLSLMFFFLWLRLNDKKMLIATGLVLGVGFLAKYQILVAAIVMLFGILFLSRDKLKIKISRFLLILLISVALVVPWLIIVIQTYGLNQFSELLYVIQVGGENRPEYSGRFFAPIFYLLEMTFPFEGIPVHPVSIGVFILGMLGIALWVWRRNPQDKYFLLWFLIIYIFFTILPNKHWRYVTLLFPVIAISASSFIIFAFNKISIIWKKPVNYNKAKFSKILASIFILIVSVATVYSSYDTYQMTSRDQVHIPIEEITNYAIKNMNENESLMIIYPFNLLNIDMMNFYIWSQNKNNNVYQYPELPVDVYNPSFNISELIELCEENNVKYTIIYDFEAYAKYYNINFTVSNITALIYESQRFGDQSKSQIFGQAPNRLILMQFQNQTQPS